MMFKKITLAVGKGNDSSSSSKGRASNEDTTALLHQDAHEDGGLSCNNEELLKDQQKAIIEWIGSMGKRILTGNINLINTPFPVNMFEPRSYLEKLADVWVYPRYLSQAAASSDPLERMKLVITWFVAGLHHGFEKWKKPFNPILGETWQAELSDGSAMYMEQISHHPPVSAFHIEGPGGLYRFKGLSQPNVSLMLKHYGFKTVAKGFRYVEFADGTRIDITYPSYCMKGVVYSKRPRAEVDGDAVLTDSHNCLRAVLRFGAVKGASGVLKRSDGITGEIVDVTHASKDLPKVQPRSREGESPSAAADEEGTDFESASETDWEDRSEEAGLGPPVDGGSAHSSYPPSPRQHHCDPASFRQAPTSTSNGHPDSFISRVGGLLGISSSQSALTKDDAGGVVLVRMEGSWLSHLNFDGKRYWELKAEMPDQWQPGATPLPSDSRFRRDLAVLATGNVAESQVWKEQMENMQRNDKKLRGGH